MSNSSQMEHPHGAVGPAHPRPLTYAKIAALLTVVTAAEVAVYYVDYLHVTGLLTPVLLVLSAVKFSLVGMFYMHLKFDSRLFSGLFLGGLFVGASIVLALIFLLHPAVVPMVS